MKRVNRLSGHKVNAVSPRRGLPWRMATLALCSALLVPGIAAAKKPVASDVGCVVFPPAYIDSDQKFTVKIVRDPAYTGVWSQPMVDVEAVFPTSNGGEVTATYSETTSRYGYGVTYVTASLHAPGCNGGCDLDTSLDAVYVTAVVKEPINKGKRLRETTCTPGTSTLNPGM